MPQRNRRNRRSPTPRRASEASSRTGTRPSPARPPGRGRPPARRVWTRVVVPVAVVVAVVLALVLVKVAGGGGGGATPAARRQPAPAAVLSAVSSVPAATLDEIGAPSGLALPRALPKAPVLTRDGKPLVVYLGAEFCPYCAGERWAMVVALSRFGSFSGLKTTRSSSTDVHPNTATVSFYGAHYTSSYLAFDPVELEDNTGAKLETTDAVQQQVAARFDPAETIPFIDFGDQWSISGPSYNVDILQGLTASQIASKLSNPSEVVAVGINGTANLITATLCQLTGQQPASVCATPGVQTATTRLTAGK